jgi:hypothetical protein
MSAVYRRYKSGPRTLPWGTPLGLRTGGVCGGNFNKKVPLVEIGLKK